MHYSDYFNCSPLDRPLSHDNDSLMFYLRSVPLWWQFITILESFTLIQELIWTPFKYSRDNHIGNEVLLLNNEGKSAVNSVINSCPSCLKSNSRLFKVTVTLRKTEVYHGSLMKFFFGQSYYDFKVKGGSFHLSTYVLNVPPCTRDVRTIFIIDHQNSRDDGMAPSEWTRVLSRPLGALPNQMAT